MVLFCQLHIFNEGTKYFGLQEAGFTIGKQCLTFHLTASSETRGRALFLVSDEAVRHNIRDRLPIVITRFYKKQA